MVKSKKTNTENQKKYKERKARAHKKIKIKANKGNIQKKTNKDKSKTYIENIKNTKNNLINACKIEDSEISEFFNIYDSKYFDPIDFKIASSIDYDKINHNDIFDIYSKYYIDNQTIEKNKELNQKKIFGKK